MKDDVVYPSNSDDNFAPEYGLTKREYFAAMAMQGIMHTREYQSMPAIAIDAVMAADALIEELAK